MAKMDYGRARYRDYKTDERREKYYQALEIRARKATGQPLEDDEPKRAPLRIIVRGTANG